METAKSNDVFAIVTNRIIAQLEQQTVPWQKPWTEAGYPQNLITKIPYRGMNVWMLASLGYLQNYFLTWKQLKNAGGTVKPGERPHLVVFWKKKESGEETDSRAESAYTSILRYYRVFNIAQCDGLPEICSAPRSPYTISKIGACEEIIKCMRDCPPIKHSRHLAFYDPILDLVNLPKQKTFKNAESYYNTLFHELVHSTGHQSRLNRKGVAENRDYASEQYSQEELVAQIGACFLNSAASIDGVEFENNVAYINGWLEKLRNDKRMIVYASIQAQKAAEYILNVQPYEKAIVEQNEIELETL